MKLGILILVSLLIGCSIPSKEEEYANDLYNRITAQVRNGDGASDSWLQIEDNILAKKKILFMIASEEFSILVVRNSFSGGADTSVVPVTDTATITASPEVDKITDAVKNLENLAKRMGGK